MQTLYITDNGMQLKKRSNRIAVKQNDKVVREIRTNDLKRILIFGNSQITTQLMRFLAGKGIEVAFLSTRGKFQYRLVPELTKNIYLRMAQHDRYRDPDFKIRFAKAIVKGKIKNQYRFLLRSNRNHPELEINKETDTLRKSINQVHEMKTIQQLRGAEGNASSVYFAAFRKLLSNGFVFTNRKYHPPPDPVNAMLGFAYMLVFNELNSLIEAFGIEAYLGFLHDIRYGRKSLASDMIEELRTPIADRLVLYLINKRIIRVSQFTKANDRVIMDEGARTNFLANYENYMTAPFLNSENEERRTYRDVCRGMIEQLENVILNDGTYSPFELNS